MDKLKRIIQFVKDSIKKQTKLYKDRVIVRKRETKTRTVFATGFYILSFLALIPSFFHILFDMLVHGPAMLTSFLMFQASEAI